MQRIRAGERHLIDVLVQRHARRLYRIARSVIRDGIEAEDVVQETWLRVLAHLDQFAGRGRFASWVARIAVREAWARVRHDRRRRANIPTWTDEANRAAMVANPERVASDREIREFIESAIDALPDSYRLVLVLLRIEGLPTAEVAQRLKL